MKERLKRNYKLIVAFIIGVIVSLGSTYAVTTISSSDISYDNSTSGLTSTNMKGAIDELNEKAKKLSNKPCRVTNGTGTDLGDVIACGTEEFYVLKQVGISVKTITKYPIEQGLNESGSGNIDNPSYLQSEQCLNGYRCATSYPTDGLSKYKENLEKIGISSLFDVRPVSINDLNEVGVCSITTVTNDICGSDKPTNISGSCANISKIGGAGRGFRLLDTLHYVPPSQSECLGVAPTYISGTGVLSGYGSIPNRAIVTIPMREIFYN